LTDRKNFPNMNREYFLKKALRRSDWIIFWIVRSDTHNFWKFPREFHEVGFW
jgi:hypothetical protein